jgi:hypothetical protein
MPRPAKAIRRQVINAAIEFKKGNIKEAYELWGKAAQSRKERYEAKHNKKKRAAEAEAAKAAGGSEG